MKIAVHRLDGLLKALQRLDGRQEVRTIHPKDGAPFDIVDTKPYLFAKPTLRLTLARNIEKLASEVRAQNVARESLTLAVYGRLDVEALPEDAAADVQSQRATDDAAFRKQYDEILNTEIEIDLIPFNSAELNADQNKIPPTVLSLLFPLFTDQLDPSPEDDPEVDVEV